MPAALQSLASEFHVTKYFHGFALGQGFSIAFALEVHALAVRTFKDESIGVVHKLY
jgi:hypothetical protein